MNRVCKYSIFDECDIDGSKVLGIIISEVAGEGLEYKIDMEWPTGEYCHEEEFRLVLCKVSSYEWIGTDAFALMVLLKKKECVECILDTDCKADYFSNSKTNHYEYCKFPKVLPNDVCNCPESTVEQGNRYYKSGRDKYL